MSDDIIRYNPTGQIGTAGNLKALLERNKESIGTVLPRHVTVERVIKMALVAANRNPKLLQCTQSSVIETIQRAAELGLDLSGTLGEAYPVPYGKDCQLIIGYRGLAKLARQSGEIDQLEAEAVHANDTFVYRKGTDFRLSFEPKLDGERGEVRGFYAYVKTKDGGHYADWMTLADVNKIRARSKAQNNGPWVTDPTEMGRKTVFRRLSKWLNLSSEKFADAIEADNLEFDDLPLTKNVTPEVVPTAAAQVMDDLAGQSILGPQATDPGQADDEPFDIGGFEEQAEMVQAPVQTVAFPPAPAPAPPTPPPPADEEADVVYNNGIDPEKFTATVKKVLGTGGPALVRNYMKAMMPGKKLFQLTDEEIDKVEKFIDDSASRMAGGG